ncbi:MAG: alpha/beta hydrolase [Firmicutes bacterium]|nr:alpha/beta hydrolase [Bacillota bacterium]
MKTYYELWEGKVPFFEEKFQTRDNQNASTVTPYLLPDGDPHPCMVIVPGGGYRHRAEHEGDDTAVWLNAMGISAFVVNYRVHPYEPVAMIADIKRAMRLVRYNAAQYNVDPERIGIMGFSAGAHLACYMSEFFDDNEYLPDGKIDKVSARPDLCVLCYPVITFEYKKLLLERDISIFEKSLGVFNNMTRISCEKNVSRKMPPVFMWHTFEDTRVPVIHSIKMAEALRKKGVEFEYHIFTNGKHGLSIRRVANTEGTNQWPLLLRNWLFRHNFKVENNPQKKG